MAKRVSSDEVDSGRLTPEMLAEHVSIVDAGSLSAWAESPYDFDVGHASLYSTTFGQMRLAVVHEGEVLYGWQHVRAEQLQPTSGGRVAVLDLSPFGWTRERAAAAALGLLRSDRQAAEDPQTLADLLLRIQDHDAELLTAAGWDGDDLDQLLADLAADNPHDSNRIDGDPDDIPDQAPAVTKPGDLWLLGDHRVICGDSTSPDVIAALLDGGRADMVWTDPPYGVAIVGGNHSLSPEKRLAAGGKTIENDALDEDGLLALLDAALGAAAQACRPGAAWFVAAPPGPLFQLFGQVLKDLGIWRQTISWVKDSLVMGRSDYHYRHEAVFYGWIPGAAHTEPPDRRQDTVWEIPRPKRSEDHPTMKPVELVARAIRNHTRNGDTVLDPFGGSGTTLIAAHQQGRTAYLMEIDPRYVDTICARWEKATGVVPVLEATGKPTSFLTSEAG